MSLPEPYRKPPIVLRRPWPPDDFVQKKEVTLADNWNTLASGRDPWRLILYNFRTRNPDEVNWYLYNWIGCRAVTPDGKNYRFGPYDDRLGIPAGPAKKLYIYIPDDRWEPDRDELARDLVCQTLLSPGARAVYFNTSAANLNFGEIGSVALAIAAGHIQVTVTPSLAEKGASAEYVPSADLIKLASLRRDLGARSRIVHEAVHAAFDARRARLTAIEEESIAYIAQCFYLQLASGPAIPPYDFDWKKLAEKAWPIATAKRTGTAANPDDFEALKSEVRNFYPHLAANPFGQYVHNGIQ